MWRICSVEVQVCVHDPDRTAALLPGLVSYIQMWALLYACLALWQLQHQSTHKKTAAQWLIKAMTDLSAALEISELFLACLGLHDLADQQEAGQWPIVVPPAGTAGSEQTSHLHVMKAGGSFLHVQHALGS